MQQQDTGGVPDLRSAGRVHALDGTRSVAVLAVFLYHGAQGLVRGGFLGVDVFLVLSGTVITLLLLRELDRTGTVRLGRFSANRLARLWPALLAVCTAVALLSLLVPSLIGDQVGAALVAATYSGDVASGFGLWDFSRSALAHTWSLAVEEQFYLVWPLLLLALVRALSRRAVIVATALLLLVPLVLRLALWHGGSGLFRIYDMPDTRADDLLAGCLLALVLVAAIGRAPMLQVALRRSIWPVAAVLVLLMLRLPGPTVPLQASSSAQWTLGPLVLALLVAAMVGGLATAPRHPLARVLAHRWIAWPGRHLSYGFYLWHVPVLTVLGATGLHVAEVLPLAFVVTAGLAVLSSRFVEEPVRRRVRAWMDRRVRSLPVAASPEGDALR